MSPSCLSLHLHFAVPTRRVSEGPGGCQSDVCCPVLSLALHLHHVLVSLILNSCLLDLNPWESHSSKSRVLGGIAPVRVGAPQSWRCRAQGTAAGICPRGRGLPACSPLTCSTEVRGLGRLPLIRSQNPSFVSAVGGSLGCLVHCLQ